MRYNILTLLLHSLGFRPTSTSVLFSRPHHVGFTTWPLFSWWRPQSFFAMLLGTSLMSCTETTQQARWRRSGRFILLEMGQWWYGQLTENSGNLDPVAKCCVTTPKAFSMSLLAINLWSHVMAMSLIIARWSRVLSQNGTWCVRRNGFPSLHSLALCWES